MSLQTQHDPKHEAEITYWNSAGGCRWVERQQSQDIVLGPILQVTLERAQLRRGERVVDIGCGTGASSIAFAERAGPSGQVRGIDVSATFQRRLPARAAERLPPGAPVKFVRADATTVRIGRFQSPFFALWRHVFRGAGPRFCQFAHGAEAKRTPRLRLLAQVR
jgi:SAM-dependent methyltransferase